MSGGDLARLCTTLIKQRVAARFDMRALVEEYLAKGSDEVGSDYIWGDK